METTTIEELLNVKVLKGHEAYEYAAAHGFGLSKYADPTEDARYDLTLTEAAEILTEDPSLIFIVVPAA